jgi:dolichol-phosphate mannosyltransferase
MTHSVSTHASMHGIFSGVTDTTTLSRSIIIPFYNEAACAKTVLEEVHACQPTAEIIAVDDGSSDATWQILCALPWVTAVQLTENRGQSAAVYAGLNQAKTDVVVLLDGDGQNDPADIEQLIARLPHADVVVGYRAKRKDTWSRRMASRFANRIRRLFLEDGVRDTGCSLKVFARAHVELLVPFNGLHRYLPAIFTKAGLKIDEVPVNHRPRVEGTSKYTNWERALRGIYDLIGVAWLLNRKVHFPRIEIKKDA